MTRTRHGSPPTKGVAKVEEKSVTLQEKAAHFEEITAARHNRRGFVTHSSLAVPGEPEQGLYPRSATTTMAFGRALYVAAESFRYAATKDPERGRLAKKSLDAMLELDRVVQVSPVTPPRAIINKGEKVYGYNPDETVRIKARQTKSGSRREDPIPDILARR